MHPDSKVLKRKQAKKEKAVSEIKQKIRDRNRKEQIPRFNEDFDYKSNEKGS